MEKSVIAYLGSVKAMITWFHSAHHLTKGSSFAGDHVNLFGDIYVKIIDDFDAIVERSIVAFDTERVACPITLTLVSHQVLQSLGSPVDASADEIAVMSLEAARAHLARLEELYQSMQGTNFLSLGMEDLIAGSANLYEGFIYLLTQRVKKGDSFK
tara:strand:- start:13481 stop:13948 length:468 start_codon:yes stop_codon:yes gene_type:complete